MTYRSRLATAFLLCTLVPLGVLGYTVLRETRARIASQYESQVEALSTTVVDAFALESGFVDAAIGGVVAVANDDNRLRAELLGVEEETEYLIGFAGDAMRRAGLDVLQIQDESGRVLSSGHFRAAFGSVSELASSVVSLQTTTPSEVILASMRTSSGDMVAIVRTSDLVVAGLQFHVTGGRRIDKAFLDRLSSDSNLRVQVAGLTDADAIVDDGSERRVGYQFAVGFIDVSGVADNSLVRIVHDASPLEALVADINRWFLFVFGASAVAALMVSLWLAAMMSRPLIELARKTDRVDLTRLNESFRTDRTDEIGLMSRKLGEMTRRLRESTGAIREAERRATLGDVARQVNHDVRNGLTPIRNVVRHLGELSDADPEAIPEVYSKRRNTLESSIAYLDDLATRYAKLSSRAPAARCDLGAIVQQVADGMSEGDGAQIRVAVSPGATILADPLSVRRLVENLVRNALQSGTENNHVQVAVDKTADDTVRVSVTDTGRGMSEETKTRIFDDFFTTKEDGTGLGLSIVRRIAMDLQGRISVESEPGKGSTFTVEFPQCP